MQVYVCKVVMCVFRCRNAFDAPLVDDERMRAMRVLGIKTRSSKMSWLGNKVHILRDIRVLSPSTLLLLLLLLMLLMLHLLTEGMHGGSRKGCRRRKLHRLSMNILICAHGKLRGRVLLMMRGGE